MIALAEIKRDIISVKEDVSDQCQKTDKIHDCLFMGEDAISTKLVSHEHRLLIQEQESERRSQVVSGLMIAVCSAGLIGIYNLTVNINQLNLLDGSIAQSIEAFIE